MREVRGSEIGSIWAQPQEEVLKTEIIGRSLKWGVSEGEPL